ncbi:MAG TPA: dihydroneopterin aldolase [Chitinophagales bacterium]|nr:dihydroneopterin aldolase [Chitinophagales bacterium]
MPQYAIGVKDLELWCPIGVHPEEMVLKSRLRITASLVFTFEENLPVSLSNTFDYTRLVQVIREVAVQPHMLLEQLCNGITQRLLTSLIHPCRFHLRIEKHNPIPGEKLNASFIDLVDDLVPGRSRR